MGLLDILHGMQNGPRGAREPGTTSGGVSKMAMALIALLGYKALKTGTQPTSTPGGDPGVNPAEATSANAPSGGIMGGLGDLLKGPLGGIPTVGRKEEWPGWTPTADEKRRLGPLPSYVEGRARNPMGARALYFYAGGQDTLYRIHGTNQPEYIGQAISSGCIRLTNEDVIDLYSRVKIGVTVVVL